MIDEKKISIILEAINPDELTELTSALVRINSVWDPKVGTSEEPVAEFIAAWAANQGFDVQKEEVAPGRPNVIITWEAGSGNRKLMYEGHTDVVTPGDLSAWSHDPFGAEIVGRRMYGRGTNDTKGNLAAMLIAMSALKRADVPLSGTIIGGVLCDEEDQMLGVQHFIDRGHADSITAAVICEPQDGLICCSQKGALRVRFTVKGKMSHGAMPLTGLNTAPALAKLIEGLNNLERQAVRLLGEDPYLGWPSFTPTVIQSPASGPPQLNVIPGKAIVLVDIRTIPRQSHSEIVAQLERLLVDVCSDVNDDYKTYDSMLNIEREQKIEINLEILTDRPCTLTDRNDAVVAAADWASRRISGAESEYAGVPGATDGTFLWAHKHIPIVTMGAGDRHVPHQADEWVDLDQLADTARIYALIALHYLNPEAGK